MKNEKSFKQIRKNLNASSVVIVGLVRNAEKSIAADLNRIQNSFRDAKKIQYIIVESDSKDNTSKAIKKLQSNYSINYISLGNLIGNIPARTERIAFCRNAYLNELKINKSYEFTDYVVVADLDGVNSHINISSVRSCWGLKTDWDACFPNQLGPYYDIWALRHPFWCSYDYFEKSDFLRSFNLSRSKINNISLYTKMIKIPKNSNVIEVQSAFGGMGIYKYECMKIATYIGKNSHQKEVCEHVYFHHQLCENKKKLIINPAFINGAWNEHNKRLKLTNQVAEKLFFLFNSIFSFFHFQRCKKIFL